MNNKSNGINNSIIEEFYISLNSHKYDKSNTTNISIRQKLKVDDEEFKNIHLDFLKDMIDFSKNYLDEIKSLVINFGLFGTFCLYN